MNETVGQIEGIIYTESEGVAALRRPLLVQFKGEQAQDANGLGEAGVRREFFMLLLAKLLDPQYGMLSEDEESRLTWFRDSSLSSDTSNRDFFLIGIICALAIYNDNIVDLRFPVALYKKLLGHKCDLSDLKELSPTVGHSMERLLAARVDDKVEVIKIESAKLLSIDNCIQIQCM